MSTPFLDSEVKGAGWAEVDRRSSSVRIRGLKDGVGEGGREGCGVEEDPSAPDARRQEVICAVAAVRERGEGGGSM